MEPFEDVESETYGPYLHKTSKDNLTVNLKKKKKSDKKKRCKIGLGQLNRNFSSKKLGVIEEENQS